MTYPEPAAISIIWIIYYESCVPYGDISFLFYANVPSKWGKFGKKYIYLQRLELK